MQAVADSQPCGAGRVNAGDGSSVRGACSVWYSRPRGSHIHPFVRFVVCIGHWSGSRLASSRTAASVYQRCAHSCYSAHIPHIRQIHQSNCYHGCCTGLPHTLVLLSLSSEFEECWVMIVRLVEVFVCATFRGILSLHRLCVCQPAPAESFLPCMLP
jgi:hypothetical protein